jgi:hypothetical protein
MNHATALEATQLFVAQYEQTVGELDHALHACLEAIERVARYVNLPTPEFEIVPDGLLLLLDTLETTPNPLKPLVGALEAKYRETQTAITVLANRLLGIGSIEPDPPISDLDSTEMANHTIQLLEQIHDKFEHSQKLGIRQAGDIEDMRGALEILDLRMHKFLGLEHTDLKQVTIPQLIARTKKYCEQVTKPSASAEFMSLTDINFLFAGVFSIVQLSSSSDPRRYIPEICAAMISLHHSVMCLKPFSTILADIVQTLDGNAHPSSAVFEAINKQVLELHGHLKTLSPVKVNSLVFSVLQKSTTLFSALINALLEKQEEAFVTREVS